MKKCILLSLLVLFSSNLFSQDDSYGKPILKIFANYHQGLSEEVSDETAFEILRAYLGWEQHFNSDWKAVIKLDIGSPDDLSESSSIKRYAYFKNAYIQYQKDKLKVGIGLVDMLHIGYPEKQWGHRYIRKEFQDQYKFGPKADIGIFGLYDISQSLTIDAFIVNGEGYKNLQRDDVYKYGGGITIKPIEGLSTRVHYDITPREIIQHTISGFIGYHFNNKWTLGFDAAYQINQGYKSDKNIFGYSVFGYYNVSNKWEVFLRYDRLGSNILEEEILPWNQSKDGTSIIGGVQYKPTDFLKFALSYQDWLTAANDGSKKSFIYLNMEVAL